MAPLQRGRRGYDETGTPGPGPSISTWSARDGVSWRNTLLCKLKDCHRELAEALSAVTSKIPTSTSSTKKMPDDLDRVKQKFVKCLIATAQTILKLDHLDISSNHSDTLLKTFKLATARSSICPDVDRTIKNLQNLQDAGWSGTSTTTAGQLCGIKDPMFALDVEDEIESLCSTYDTCRRLLSPWLVRVR